MWEKAVGEPPPVETVGYKMIDVHPHVIMKNQFFHVVEILDEKMRVDRLLVFKSKFLFVLIFYKITKRDYLFYKLLLMKILALGATQILKMRLHL